jgi:methyl-accepting chemotaxis protein
VRWFADLRIAGKLALLTFITMVCLIVVGAMGYWSMKGMADNSNQMYKNRLLPVEWLNKMRTNHQVIEGAAYQMITRDDPALWELLEMRISKKMQENQQLMVQYKGMHLDEYEQKQLSWYERVNADLQRARQKAMELRKRESLQVALTHYEQNGEALQVQLDNLLEELADYNRKVADELDRESRAQFVTAGRVIAGTTAGTLAVSLLLGLLVARRIAGPVQEMQGLMERAEQGDLTVQGSYRSKDEIGALSASFNRMIVGLRDLVGQVRESAVLLSVSSEELSASANLSAKASIEIATTITSIAAGSDEQVALVESGQQVLQEVNEKIGMICESAERVNARATEASHMALEGNEAVQSAVEQMGSINGIMSEMEQVIQGLGEHSQSIGQIVETITGIAAQTNLLALNAAIESARAGEHGRGFAVVADEVRKLAEQSSDSARRIGEYIAVIQNEIQNAVQTMQHGAQEVRTGTDLVGQAGKAFVRIRLSVEEVARQMQEVSTAAQEMAANSQVTQAMRSISGSAISNAASTQQASAATQEQLATMREIAASSDELAKMAEELQQMVGRFRV